MLKRVLTLVMGVCAALAVAQCGPAGNDNERIAHAVVMIRNIDASGETFTWGSGTIVDPKGVIVTNGHVAEGGSEFEIYITEDIADPPVHRYFARALWISPDFDFAILQIDRDADRHEVTGASLRLPTIPLARTPVDLGDEVRVFGFPGLARDHLAVTQGRIATIQNGEVDGERMPIWYQTDAEISPGNSGGLAVNQRGEFIGIPTEVAHEEHTGGRLGNLLPVELVRALLERFHALGPTLPSDSPGGPGADAVVELDPTLRADLGGVTMRPGFTPDPYAVDVSAGGGLAVAGLGYGQGCVGFATAQPQFSVAVEGEVASLHVYFAGDGDTALIVNDPNRRWLCNDDAAGSTNPLVSVTDVQTGRYDIWVSSYYSGARPSGVLYISQSPIDPAALPQAPPPQ